MDWRLGLDLGANSLGWAALRLDDAGKPRGFLAAGSRIFSDGRDPKSGASLAGDRRAARSMRKRLDRLKRRKTRLQIELTEADLFPATAAERKALEVLDPFALRARALDEKLSLHEIGRAFLHLNQRRGFQSNRKADRGQDDEAGKVAIGIDRLETAIAEKGARTFGEFLHMRRREAVSPNAIPSVRTRLRGETAEDVKGQGYDFYPSRALIKAEFDAIWHAQAEHHPDALTALNYARLHETVFHQRPLKAPEVGKCTLVPSERRLPKAHPAFQRRRLLEEVNALMIVRAGEIAERLRPEQRDLVVLKLRDKKSVTFASMRKALKLDPAARFNKESENRTELKGDEVTAEMAHKERFGTLWHHLSPAEQWEVVQRHLALESEADEAAFTAWLIERHKLDAKAAAKVLGARLPQGYGRFGPTATETLVDALTHDRDEQGRVLVYSEAVERAGLGHHSDLRTGEVFEEEGRPSLPYYGVALERHIMPGSADPDEEDEAERIGRFTNPTVHIGLNQLRRVVNALIRAYGPPKEIALELARELKLSEDEKKERNRENARNRADAQRRSRALLGLDADGAPIGRRVADDTGGNRALLKLWEELNPGNVLDRRCIYTGQQISIDMLFSGTVEVDHILPFDATLDDSNANKIVCIREANRFKRKRSPFEAWGHTEAWADIAERASRLPRNKRWRFEPDAMQRFADEGGFLARHLVDTQYLGRCAHEYLSTLYPERGEGSRKVWVSPGRLTEMVRRKLGLNTLLPDHNFGGGADQPKNRLDHRHHAIDAAVVAILDRSMLNLIAAASAQGNAEEAVRVLVPEPWAGFRDELATTVNAIVVSHRPDHGTIAKGRSDKTAGRLHNDTAYGLTGEMDEKGNTIVVRRLPLTSFKKASDIDRVRDPQLRQALHNFTAGYEGKALEARLARFPEIGPLDYRGIRRVRITEPLTVIPIHDRQGKPYKGYKGDSNYRYDVWELPDGKWVTHWTDREGVQRSSIVSMFDAHQEAEQPRPQPAARRVLSLQRNDIVLVELKEGWPRLMRVVKFGQNGQVTLAAPNEGGDLKRRDAAPNDEDPFKYIAPTAGGLKKLRTRKVRVDEIGHVLDPGFPARKRVRPTRRAQPPQGPDSLAAE